VAIKFSAKEQPKTPAKAGKPAPAADSKPSAAEAADNGTDLFEAEAAKPAAKGRKKK
jgi:hypothetical protein